jgi:hypothetical protein
MPIPTELFTTIAGRITSDSAHGSKAAAIRVWQTLFNKFAPLLGPLSADLLFARSLRVNGAAFPWLPQVAPNAAPAAFGAFERSLDGRTAQDIVEVNHALLSTYTSVLAELIGARLATQLLAAAFPDVETTKDI